MNLQSVVPGWERLRSLKLSNSIPALRCPCCGSQQWKLSCSQCGHERVRVGEELRLAFEILYQKFFLSWYLFGRTFAMALRDPMKLLRGYREEGAAFLDRERLLRPASYFVSSIGILVLVYSLFVAENASSLAGSAAYFILFVLTSLSFAALLHRASRLLGGSGGFPDTFAALVYGHGAQLSVIPLLINLALLSYGASTGRSGLAILGSFVMISASFAFLVWAAMRTVPRALAEVHGFSLRRGCVVLAGVGAIFYLLGNLLSPFLNSALL